MLSEPSSFCYPSIFNLGITKCGFSLFVYLTVPLVSYILMYRNFLNVVWLVSKRLVSVVIFITKVLYKLMTFYRCCTWNKFKLVHKDVKENFGYEPMKEHTYKSIPISKAEIPKVEKPIINPLSGYCDQCKSNLFCPMKVYKPLYKSYKHCATLIPINLIIAGVIIMFNNGSQDSATEFMLIPYKFLVIILLRILFDTFILLTLKLTLNDFALDILSETIMIKFARNLRLSTIVFYVTYTTLLVADFISACITLLADTEYSLKYKIYLCLITLIFIFNPFIFVIKTVCRLSKIIKIGIQRTKYIKKPSEVTLSDLEQYINANRSVSLEEKRDIKEGVVESILKKKSLSARQGSSFSSQGHSFQINSLEMAKSESKLDIGTNREQSENHKLKTIVSHNSPLILPAVSSGYSFTIKNAPSKLMPSAAPSTSGDNVQTLSKVPVTLNLITPSSKTILSIDCGCKCCSPDQTYTYGKMCGLSICSKRSFLTFSWVTYFISLTRHKVITSSDLYPLPEKLDSLYLYNHFFPQFIRDSKTLFNYIFAYSKKEFIIAGILKFVYDSLQLFLPMIVNIIIRIINRDSETVGVFAKRDVIILMLMLLILSKFIQTICLQQYFNIQFLSGLKLQSALSVSIYQKSLKIHLSDDKFQPNDDIIKKKNKCMSCCSSRKLEQDVDFSTSNIVNLMSIDTQRIANAMPYIHVLWSAVYQIVVSLILLYIQLKEGIIGGFAVMLIIIICVTFLINKVKKLQLQMTKFTDKRVKMITEFLNGNRICKMYGWELPLLNEITLTREEELKLLRYQQFLSNIQYFMWSGVTVLVSIVSFGIYGKLGYVLTPDVAFTSLSLIDIMRFPLNILPNAISLTTFASVASRRIEKFLRLPEIENVLVRSNSTYTKVTAIHLTTAWPNNRIIVNDISFQCSCGTITAIIGKTGSGKTGLLKAILGEFVIQKKTLDRNYLSSLSVNGRIAYVAQTSWIQNATFRENILFGQPYDKVWYLQVVKACALIEDLKILPHGDKTEIGEKGVNLSGGQKQRIALARAAYRANDDLNKSTPPTDIFVLDDCLSAVDMAVANHIFTHCLIEILKARNKIVIIATHKIDLLSRIDNVIFLRTLSEQQLYDSVSSAIYVGPPKDLFKLPEYIELTESFQEHDLEKHQEVTIKKSPSNLRSSKFKSISSERDFSISSDMFNREKFIQDEVVDEGAISVAVFFQYFNGSGGFLIVSFILLTTLASYIVMLVNRIYLSYATDSLSSDSNSGIRTFNDFFTIYTILGSVQILLLLFASMCQTFSSIKASNYFHSKMLNRILRAPLYYFDATPIGRLLNRFSRDINIIDTLLPSNLLSYMNMMFSVMATLVTIIYFLPWFGLLCLPILIFYFTIQKFFLPCTRQLQRIQNVEASPVFTHFAETIDGASTIRAFQEEKRFMEKNIEILNSLQKANFMTIATNRWLAVRLETVGILIVALSTNLSVYSMYTHHSSKDNVGFFAILSYVTSITQTLNWMVRMASDTQSNIVSVERVQKTIDETPLEAPLYLKHEKEDTNAFDKGEIELKNFCLRYRPGLPLVLNNLCCVIKSCERVGLVGRTGAGKSSMMLALLRLVEPASGHIIIDGIDISTMGLHNLRKQISIIPQDSVLFSGSLRFNLDPFASETTTTLKLPDTLKTYFDSQFPNGLDENISDGGRNLSVGQKQLICLGRALIRKSKILLLDEATSSLDVYTDQLIQMLIRTEFKHCTVLTIAHRINTVLDYDKIMVLDHGEIAEFDTPDALIKKKTSLFSKLLEQAKIV